MRISVITFLLVCLFFKAEAQLTSAKLFASHMVLQQNQALPVWGWAAKRAKVTVSIAGQSVSARADDAGNWKVMLKPMMEGGPYTMNITSGNQHLDYNDVMLGEVWICSGQSNMEFQLRNALGYKAELKNAQQQPIRQFRVPDKMSLEPE